MKTQKPDDGWRGEFQYNYNSDLWFALIWSAVVIYFIIFGVFCKGNVKDGTNIENSTSTYIIDKGKRVNSTAEQTSNPERHRSCLPQRVGCHLLGSAHY